jgi:hypothetical protein
MMMRKGKEDAAAHKTDDFGISIFILFCFSFLCERVSESSKELRRYFLDTDTKQHFFFALGILTISRINVNLTAEEMTSTFLFCCCNLPIKKRKVTFCFVFCLPI